MTTTTSPASVSTERAATIDQLERALAAQRAALSRSAPRQLQDLEFLLGELKASRSASVTPAAKTMIRRLFLWQLERQRSHYRQRLASLPAGKARAALEPVLAVLDEAERALQARAASGAPKVEKAAERARAALRDFAPGAKTKAAAPPGIVTGFVSGR